MRIRPPLNHASVTSTRENWLASASVEASSRCTFPRMSQSRKRARQNRFADHIVQRLK